MDSIILEKTETGFEATKKEMSKIHAGSSIARYKNGMMKITNKETGYVSYIARYSDTIMKSIDKNKFHVEVR